MTEAMLTVAHMCRLTGFSRDVIYAAIERNEFPNFNLSKTGGKYTVPENEFEAWRKRVRDSVLPKRRRRD